MYAHGHSNELAASMPDICIYATVAAVVVALLLRFSISFRKVVWQDVHINVMDIVDEEAEKNSYSKYFPRHRRRFHYILLYISTRSVCVFDSFSRLQFIAFFIKNKTSEYYILFVIIYTAISTRLRFYAFFSLFSFFLSQTLNLDVFLFIRNFSCCGVCPSGSRARSFRMLYLSCNQLSFINNFVCVCVRVCITI